MFHGDILKKLRVEKEMNQKELANILEINRVQYNQYENDYNNIPIKHLNTISNYYDVSIDYILGLTDKLKYQNSYKELELANSSQRIKEIRKENKLTQIKLADILNTTQAVVANYERGRNFISTPFLYTICTKYHVSADYLLGKTDSPKYLS